MSTGRLSLVLFPTVLALLALLGCDSHAYSLAPPLITLERGNAIHSEFVNVVGVEELSDGSVLVADAALSELYRFDGGGTPEVIVRSGGEGPGEYSRIQAFWRLAADTTGIYDGRGSRLVLQHRGSPAGETRIAQDEPRWLRGVDTVGTFLTVSQFRVSAGPSAPEGAYLDSIVVMRVERTLFSADTVARLFVGAGRTYRRSNGVLASLTDPLLPADEFLLFPDGWVAIAHSAPYHVVWISPTGEELQGPIIVDGLPVAASDEAIATAIAGGSADLEMKRAVLQDYSGRLADGVVRARPHYMPPFLSTGLPALIPAPGGLLLVRRTVVPDSRWVPYDIFDRSGERIGQLQLPWHEYIVGLGADVLYVVSIDSLGFQELRRVPWPL